MGALNDPVILAQYRGALALWNCTGYVNWKGPPLAFVQRELEGYTARIVSKLMHEHVEGGGTIHQHEETREQWLEWPFHYDLYVPVGGREIYIETVLDDDEPDDCTILVVSAHDP